MFTILCPISTHINKQINAGQKTQLNNRFRTNKRYIKGLLEVKNTKISNIYFLQVKHWITFNEPWVICWMGYGSAEYAPGIKDPAVAPYRCGHNIIRSHAKAFDTYNMRYRSLQKGKSYGKIYCTGDVTRPGAFGLSYGLCGICFLQDLFYFYLLYLCCCMLLCNLFTLCTN